MGGFVRNITGQTAARRAAEAGAGQQLELSQAAEEQARGDILGQFDPSLAASNLGFRRAEDVLRGSMSGIEDAINIGSTGAINELRGFADLGGDAAQREAALSGALGNEAQQQAFQSFNESPGQAFLREMGEKAALRGASSQGRSLGGGVLAELQRRGTGLAQQDFGNQLARLSSIATRGQQAGGGIANILSGQGSQLAGVRGNLASNLANLQTGRAGQEVALRSALGTGLANITTGQAANQSQIIGNRTSNIGNATLAGGQMLTGLVGAGLGAGAQLATGGA